MGRKKGEETRPGDGGDLAGLARAGPTASVNSLDSGEECERVLALYLVSFFRERAKLGRNKYKSQSIF